MKILIFSILLLFLSADLQAQDSWANNPLTVEQQKEINQFFINRLAHHKKKKTTLVEARNDLLSAIEKNEVTVKTHGLNEAASTKYLQQVKDKVLSFELKDSLIAWEKEQIKTISSGSNTIFFNLTKSNKEENWDKGDKTAAGFIYIWTVPVDIVSTPLNIASWAIWGLRH
jgi:hypothetical protein